MSEASLISGGLCAVFDRLGGAAGERAVVVAHTAFFHEAESGSLCDAIEAASQAVHDAVCAETSLRGAGCTVAALKLERDAARIARLGDVRVVLVRDGRAASLTPPHALAGHSDIIVRALVMAATAEPDTLEVPTRVGDVFVLLSNAVFTALGEPTIAASIGATPEDSATSLIEQAIRRNATDDLTVVVMIGRGRATSNVTAAAKSRAAWL